jgi:selenoprotein W-related protein
VSLAGDLVREFEHEIQSLEILPSDGGRFEVRVNEALVFSKKQVGRHAEPGEVVRLVREAVKK